jgi:AraC-like DNA-binding protein
VGDPARSVGNGPIEPTPLLYCGVADGAVEARVDEAPPVCLAPNTSLVVAPGRRLQLAPAPASGKPTTCLLLGIGRDAAPHVAAQLGTGALPAAPVEPENGNAPHIGLANTPAMGRVVRALASLTADAAPHRDALIDLTAAQLLLHLLLTPAHVLLLSAPPHRRLPVSSAVPSGIIAALQYVHDHIHYPLSVDDLADRACMSRSTFYRHFQAALGTTPLRYVNRVRIERAQALLRDPDRTVTDVCLTLGFGSVSHFIATFKRRVGTTPKAYQRALQR